ncbi:IS1096 element passenger TnpR family protein [Endozoicomonas ascidiicola]|uniref:IS1096 element passenger TnpR family protein n=1 Tax=Endozoicomonas ascidiicola TaxID=1698521 RepID=UPI00082E9434|nr:hypothetical protein [Endozoicomonas ascidiicola]
MIISLNIKLVYGIYYSEDWQCELALEESTTLEALHRTIQRAVDFDDDHMFEFYIARTERSGERQRFECDDSSDMSCQLKDLFPLEKGRKLFYWFDYGDDWKFQISRSRKKPFVPEPGVKYPRVVSEEGVRPVQYPSVEC